MELPTIYLEAGEIELDEPGDRKELEIVLRELLGEAFDPAHIPLTDHSGTWLDTATKVVSLDTLDHIRERYQEVEALKVGEADEVWNAYLAYINNHGNEDVDEFQEAYQGVWGTEEEFAEQLFDDHFLSDVPENIRGYIDYEKFSNDLFGSDYTSEETGDGRVFVFRNV